MSVGGERPVPDKLLDELLADVPGVHPAVQQRSRDLVARLLQCGLDLLRSRDFDGLTIDDLCARAGATVGSFYARFANKQAFLLALQHLVVEETQARIERDFAPGRDHPTRLPALVEWLCLGTIAWYRHYEGFVRATLRQSGADPQAWEPVWRLGVMKLDRALPLFEGAVGRSLRAGEVHALRLAFQMLNGTLNTMLLIDPGPQRLHDERTPAMLVAAITAQVQKAIAAPGATSRSAVMSR